MESSVEEIDSGSAWDMLERRERVEDTATVTRRRASARVRDAGSHFLRVCLDHPGFLNDTPRWRAVRL